MGQLTGSRATKPPSHQEMPSSTKRGPSQAGVLQSGPGTAGKLGATPRGLSADDHKQGGLRGTLRAAGGSASAARTQHCPATPHSERQIRPPARGQAPGAGGPEGGRVAAQSSVTTDAAPEGRPHGALRGRHVPEALHEPEGHPATKLPHGPALLCRTGSPSTHGDTGDRGSRPAQHRRRRGDGEQTNSPHHESVLGLTKAHLSKPSQEKLRKRRMARKKKSA